MPSSFRRSLPITGVAVLMTGALAVAQIATPAPRVRSETTQAATLRAGRDRDGETFETDSARRASEQVRLELCNDRP